MEDIKPIKIRATVYWAFLNKPNELSGKYSVDLGNLSDTAVKKLEEMGIEVKHKDDRGFYISCKSHHEIYAFDTSGSRINEIVGNGSIAEAVIGCYSWTFKNKKGISPALKKLVIKELVIYEGAGNDPADAEEAL